MKGATPRCPRHDDRREHHARFNGTWKARSGRMRFRWRCTCGAQWSTDKKEGGAPLQRERKLPYSRQIAMAVALGGALGRRSVRNAAGMVARRFRCSLSSVYSLRGPLGKRADLPARFRENGGGSTELEAFLGWARGHRRTWKRP